MEPERKQNNHRNKNHVLDETSKTINKDYQEKPSYINYSSNLNENSIDGIYKNYGDYNRNSSKKKILHA